MYGLSVDNAAKIKGEHGLMVGEIVEKIPQDIKCVVSRITFHTHRV